jgi:hypothetical protein
VNDPVFVIHGVGNRDEPGFEASVERLGHATGLDLVPVFWGDLGADDRHVDLALPPSGAPADGDPVIDALFAPLPSAGPGGLRSADGLPEAVAEEIRRRLSEAYDGAGLREGPDEVLSLVADAWPETRWLSRTDDTALLTETAAALADAVAELDATDDGFGGFGGSGTWDGLRAGPGDGEGRLKALLHRRLRELDRIAGAAIRAVAGRVNHSLRSRCAPGATRFLGDVLVYQRHRELIHARVRERIAAVDPALGRGPDRPVRLAAHSLGGVISVDMATAAEPLWTSALVTFGSQPAYFHLCDPRGGQLPPYAGPVTLPPSLGGWTNLWEPLDLLAFAASRVFRLHDGSVPLDVPLRHAASAGLWTHSAYWELPEVAESIARAMA